MRNDAFSTISAPFRDHGPGGPQVVVGVVLLFALGFLLGLFVGDDAGRIRLLKAEQRAVKSLHAEEVDRLQGAISSLSAQVQNCRTQLSEARKAKARCE